MQQHPQASDSAATVSRRALLGVLGLVALTLGSLGLAWLMPDETLLHYLWVAQAVPVLYWLLAWWVTQRAPSQDDAP